MPVRHDAQTGSNSACKRRPAGFYMRCLACIGDLPRTSTNPETSLSLQALGTLHVRLEFVSMDEAMPPRDGGVCRFQKMFDVDLFNAGHEPPHDVTAVSDASRRKANRSRFPDV